MFPPDTPVTTLTWENDGVAPPPLISSVTAGVEGCTTTTSAFPSKLKSAMTGLRAPLENNAIVVADAAPNTVLGSLDVPEFQNATTLPLCVVTTRSVTAHIHTHAHTQVTQDAGPSRAAQPVRTVRTTPFPHTRLRLVHSRIFGSACTMLLQKRTRTCITVDKTSRDVIGHLGDYADSNL